MFCDQCGNKTEENSRFCDGCGFSFITESKSIKKQSKQKTEPAPEISKDKTGTTIDLGKLFSRRALLSIGAIIVIIVGGNVTFSLYQKYQTQVEDSSQELLKLQDQIQKVQKSTGESLTKLREENEELKSESEELKTTIHSVSSNSQKQQISSTNDLSQELLNKIMPYIVKVRCVEGGNTSEGSGVIQSSASGSMQWSVYTNLHVTGLNNYCTVSLSTGVDFVPTKTYSANLVGVGSYQEYPDVDFAVLRISKATESFGEFPLPACGVVDVKIGNQVTVFGYPNFGGDSMTVTDGIISGIEYTAYGPVYKTSAKIDRGNSGGLAINNNSKCGIGIPTWATSGAFDGLGYIQSWDMIKKSGNL